MSTWSSNYRDNRWQRKRLEIMERDGFKCQSCGAGEKGDTLNVHHIYYEKGKRPWEYDDGLLVTWCETCHGRRHELQKEFLIKLATIRIGNLENLRPFFSVDDPMFDKLAVFNFSAENFCSLLDAVNSISSDVFEEGYEHGENAGINRRERNGGGDSE